MSRSHKEGHGRCTLCGDAAKNNGRRAKDALGLDAIPDGIEEVAAYEIDDHSPCDGCSRCDPSFGEGDDLEWENKAPAITFRDVVRLAI